MKLIHKNFLLSLIAILFAAASGGQALAYDHDEKGWFDKDHHHHPFVKHNGHRGYWDHDKNGTKIFINV